MAFGLEDDPPERGRASCLEEEPLDRGEAVDLEEELPERGVARGCGRVEGVPGRTRSFPGVPGRTRRSEGLPGLTRSGSLGVLTARSCTEVSRGCLSL